MQIQALYNDSLKDWTEGVRMFRGNIRYEKVEVLLYNSTPFLNPLNNYKGLMVLPPKTHFCTRTRTHLLNFGSIFRKLIVVNIPIYAFFQHCPNRSICSTSCIAQCLTMLFGALVTWKWEKNVFIYALTTFAGSADWFVSKVKTQTYLI